MASYGTKLERLIENSGFSNTEVAEKIGVTPGNITQLTRVEYPKLEKIDMICKALGIDLWKFFLPDDIIIPEMSPQQAEWNNAFNKLPDPIKIEAQNALMAILRAYKYGRDSKAG